VSYLVGIWQVECCIEQEEYEMAEHCMQYIVAGESDCGFYGFFGRWSGGWLMGLLFV